MKLARILVVTFLLNGLAGLHSAAQKAPDLENGFKSYGSYDSSHLDTVNLMNGNLMLHAPLLPNYPQRGKLGLQPILAFNSKTWQVICADTNLGPMCGWFKGGTGVALQRPMDLGIQRTIDNFFTGTQVLVTAQGYSLTSADGATHQLVPTVISHDSRRAAAAAFGAGSGSDTSSAAGGAVIEGCGTTRSTVGIAGANVVRIGAAGEGAAVGDGGAVASGAFR